MADTRIRLAVLLSGSGTTLQNMLDCIASDTLRASVEVVIGSKPGLAGLERAAKAKISHHVVERKTYPDVATFSQKIFKMIDLAEVDLICLAGWLCLIDPPQRYSGRIMNIHPGLLPAFGGKGMFGHHVHEAVLAHGCKVAGCTVHFVDNSYDNGPIIIQRSCPVLEDDTADTLAKRVFQEEKIAYPEAIRLFQQGRLKIEGRRVRVLAG